MGHEQPPPGWKSCWFVPSIHSNLLPTWTLLSSYFITWLPHLLTSLSTASRGGLTLFNKNYEEICSSTTFFPVTNMRQRQLSPYRHAISFKKKDKTYILFYKIQILPKSFYIYTLHLLSPLLVTLSLSQKHTPSLTLFFLSQSSVLTIYYNNL